MNVIRPYVNISPGNGLVPSAIAWDNVDQNSCRHMVSLGHDELIREVAYNTIYLH